MMKPAEPRRAPHLSPERAAGGLAEPTHGMMLLTPDRRAQLVQWFRLMLLIRHFEEAAAVAYTRARVGGYLHLNVGEEASVVGSMEALQKQDFVFSNYREHGHALVRGTSAKQVMAELYGKETGISKGRGGSMHLFDLKNRMMGGYGIVGGALPLAVGAALAQQYESTDAVVMTIFGEGATNIGAFNESMNLAALWNLPVVFFCQNNQFAMGKRVSEDSAVAEIWKKACAYDMAAERVDGMDILAVYAATVRAADRARYEHRPTLVESVTYRFRGHSMADAGKYRTPEEVEEWRRRDPIFGFRDRLEQAGLLSRQQAAEIESSVEAEVEEAVQFADESPFPPLSSLHDDVYCQPGEEQHALDLLAQEGHGG